LTNTLKISSKEYSFIAERHSPTEREADVSPYWEKKNKGILFPHRKYKSAGG